MAGNSLLEYVLSCIELKSALMSIFMVLVCLPVFSEGRVPASPTALPQCWWSIVAFNECVVRMNNEAIFNVCQSATSKPFTLG